MSHKVDLLLQFRTVLDQADGCLRENNYFATADKLEEAAEIAEQEGSEDALSAANKARATAKICRSMGIIFGKAAA